MTNVNEVIAKLRGRYHLDIRAPFSMRVGEEAYEFQCLIQGYGAKNGMVVDSEWKKIAPIQKELVEMGFGYSCFDLENTDIDTFQEVLDDWGKVNA
jgi:hypothetical protein